MQLLILPIATLHLKYTPFLKSKEQKVTRRNHQDPETKSETATVRL
jgi:hypothetical protein